MPTNSIIGYVVTAALLLFILFSVLMFARRIKQNRKSAVVEAEKKQKAQESQRINDQVHQQKLEEQFQEYMAKTPVQLQNQLALTQRLLAHEQKSYAETEAKVKEYVYEKHPETRPSKHPHLNKMFFKVFKPAGDVAPGGLANQNPDRSVEQDAFMWYCASLNTMSSAKDRITDYEEQIGLMNEALNRRNAQ